MKAVIVEIDGKYAVALNKNGDFIKTKSRKGYLIGHEVEISNILEFRAKALAKYGSIAAAVFFFAIFGYGTYLYATPYSYVDIDINPSVELTANIFDRIIKAEALSDDGKKLLESNSLSNKGIQEGVRIILESARKEGYISSGGQNEVMVTVSGKSDSKIGKVENEVKTAVSSEVKAASPDASVTVEKVSAQRHSEAREMGISPGKLLLIEKLKKYEPDLNVIDYKGKPAKEIMKSINEHKKAEDANKKESDRKGKTPEKPDEQQSGENAKDNGGDNDNKGAVYPGKDIIKTSGTDKRNEEGNKNNDRKSGSQNGKNQNNKENGDKNNVDKNNKSESKDKSKAVEKKKNNNRNNNKAQDGNKDKTRDKQGSSGQGVDNKDKRDMEQKAPDKEQDRNGGNLNGDSENRTGSNGTGNNN